MPDNVIALRGTEVSGVWDCTQCQAQWEKDITLPWGTTLRDHREVCPDCGCRTGSIKGEFIPEDPVWVCDCGNTLFYITQGGMFCPGCGGYWTDIRGEK